MTDRLRAGIFLAPFHPVDENPTLAIERDFQLIEHLDRLGYDEAWVGEHHSAGYEIIGSPEGPADDDLLKVLHIAATVKYRPLRRRLPSVRHRPLTADRRPRAARTRPDPLRCIAVRP